MKPLHGRMYETHRGMTPQELQQSVIALGQQNVGQEALYMYSRLAYKNLLNAFEYAYLKCARCGDEMMRTDPIEAEIEHTLKGCNGSLYHFDPTAAANAGL